MTTPNKQPPTPALTAPVCTRTAKLIFSAQCKNGSSRMAENQNALQTTFMDALVTREAEVTLYLVTGIKLAGTITAHDRFTLLLARDNQVQMVFKSAISTIMPRKPIQLGDA